MSDGGPAIELAGVTFGYDPARPLLRDASVAFPAGKVSSIVGPNGCGKSTLVRLATRACVPARGTVRLLGDDVASLPRREVARRVAVLAQGAQVPSMEVAQLVMGGRYPHLGAFASPTARDHEIVADALERAGCARFAHHDVRSLSGGERQRVYLALVLAQQTPVVVMDEPTTYLDPRACFELMDMVAALNREGKTVVMVLHDLNLALTRSDYVAVMGFGGPVAFGTPDEVCARGAIEATLHVALHRFDQAGRLCYCLAPA